MHMTTITPTQKWPLTANFLQLTTTMTDSLSAELPEPYRLLGTVSLTANCLCFSWKEGGEKRENDDVIMFPPWELRPHVTKWEQNNSQGQYVHSDSNPIGKERKHRKHTTCIWIHTNPMQVDN